MISEVVKLRNGPLVLVEAIRLMCALEERGWEFYTQGDGILHCTNMRGHKTHPRTYPMSTEENEAITRMKPHILAIAGYCCDRNGMVLDQAQHLSATRL